MSITEELAEKYLQIARMLYQRVPLAEIVEETKVSGKTIGLVNKLIRNGYIDFDKEGRPSFTVSLDEINEFIEEEGFKPPKTKTKRKRTKGNDFADVSGPPQRAAEKAIEATVKTEIAKEATERTNKYLELGKRIAAAWYKWCQDHKIPFEKAARTDPTPVILQALDYMNKARKIEAENRRLRQALELLAREVDPVVRLKNAAVLMTRFMEFAILAELLGFNVEGSSVIQHYNRLINAYLTGNEEILREAS